MRTGAVCVAVGMVLAGAVAQSARSAEASTASTRADDALGEIVVTALRRDQRLVDAPVSVSAFDGTRLEQSGARDFGSLLGAAPGLSQETARPGFQKFSIRGVTAGGQFGWRQGAATAVYFDETPLTTRTNFWFASPDVALYDLERVEVLRGPQGTLYGASAIGGAVRALPRAASLDGFEARAALETSATEGSDALNWAARGVVNLPVASDRLALRLVVERVDDAGFLDAFKLRTQEITREARAGAPRIEDFNDLVRTSARATATIAVTDDLTVTPGVFHQRNEGGGASSSRLNALGDLDATVFAFNPSFEASGEAYEFLDDEFTVVSLKIDYRAPVLGGVRFLSNTSHQDRDARQRDDAIAANANWVEGYGFDPDYDASLEPQFNDFATRVRQFTQELRVQSTGARRFDWVAGAFYNRLEQRDSALYDLRGSNPGLLAAYGLVGTQVYDGVDDFEEEQFAGFVDMTYRLGDRLEASVGMRWTRYEQTLDRFARSPAFGDDAGERLVLPADDSDFTPRFAVSYRPADDLLLYASAAQGFRSGGGNAPEIPVAGRCPDRAALPPRPAQFGPDSLWSYEVGGKGRFADGAVAVAGAAYVIDWSDIQTAVLYNCSDNTTINWVDNAGKARVRGVEIEVGLRPLDTLTVRGTMGYTDGEFAEDSTAAGIVDGQPMPYIPKWTYAIGAEWNAAEARIGALAPFVAIDHRRVGSRLDPNYGPLADPERGRDLAAYGITDARIGLRGERWQVTLFARNLFDADVALEQFLLFNPPGFTPTGFDSRFVREEFVVRPRTVGLAAELRF